MKVDDLKKCPASWATPLRDKQEHLESVSNPAIQSEISDVSGDRDTGHLMVQLRMKILTP